MTEEEVASWINKTNKKIVQRQKITIFWHLFLLFSVTTVLFQFLPIAIFLLILIVSVISYKRTLNCSIKTSNEMNRLEENIQEEQSAWFYDNVNVVFSFQLIKSSIYGIEKYNKQLAILEIICFCLTIILLATQ